MITRCPPTLTPHTVFSLVGGAHGVFMYRAVQVNTTHWFLFCGEAHVLLTYTVFGGSNSVLKCPEHFFRF